MIITCALFQCSGLHLTSMEGGGEPFDIGALLEWDAGERRWPVRELSSKSFTQKLGSVQPTYLNTLLVQALCRKTLLYLDIAML